MRDVMFVNYHELKTDNEGLLSLSSGDVEKNSDFLFPISFDRETLEKNYNLFKVMVSKVGHNDSYTLSFDANRCLKITYDEWQTLIAFAKEKGIKFKINNYDEYTAEELDRYLNKFTVFNKGKKEFVFDTDYFMVDDNPLNRGRTSSEADFKDVTNSRNVFYIGDSKSSLNKYVEDSIVNGNEIIFSLGVGEKFDDKAKKRVKSMINYLGKKYGDKKFDVYFSNYYQYYDKEEFENLLEVEKYIKERNNGDYELKFVGNGKAYSKSQVVNANMKIEDVVKKLRESSMSPYEKVLYVHKLLSELSYREFKDNGDMSRNIYGVLNTRNVISVGYSALFQAIFKELNDENIKVQAETLKLTDNFFDVNYHSINCVYINDEKYGISGYYNLDTSCNSETDDLNNFMIPVADVNYCYANKFKIVSKVTVASKGNLMDQAYSFSDNINCDKSVMDQSSQEQIFNSTVDFLNTDMGRYWQEKLEIKRISTVDDIQKIINYCIEGTDYIPFEDTYEALKKVASEMYNMDENESEKYAKSVIARTCFQSLFFHRRERCHNAFARVSSDVEKGGSVINKSFKSSALK